MSLSQQHSDERTRQRQYKEQKPEGHLGVFFSVPVRGGEDTVRGDEGQTFGKCEQGLCD